VTARSGRPTLGSASDGPGRAALVTPKGMGDLLPKEASARRALGLRVLRSFELCGYELVTPPVFEHADVVQRGNDAIESRDLLRFVEPESGEVAVLRPDITPQIARIVATRLADFPQPIRVCYEGRVFRRQHGRARSHQQLSQAGVECVGLANADGDTEVLALAIRACEDAGLREFRVELSDVRLARSLLAAVPPALRDTVSAVLAHKDAASLRAVLGNARVPRSVVEQLEVLIDCYGGSDVLAAARRHFRTGPARAGLASLAGIVERLSALGGGSRVCFDLGETRGLSYYTGLQFTILAPGPGEALGGGGRYDDLLRKFGFDAPATGFALDLGNLQWTLREAGRGREERGLRVLVTGKDAHRIEREAQALRARDVVAATLCDTNLDRCLAFARTWDYPSVVVVGSPTLRLIDVASGSTRSLSRLEAQNLKARLAEGARVKRTEG
jgi:ATP phosphoribosyltransferase regulatory subunit